MTAAREGTAEIGLAVLATTLSIVAVFVPVAFMKGIIGRFFFQFGITVAFAVLVSLFVSFTLDPMLSSRWVDPDVERNGKRHAGRARPRPLQRLVRPDGRPLQGARSAGRSTTARRSSPSRPPPSSPASALFGTLAVRVHGQRRPGRVPGQVQDRARRLLRGDARPDGGRPRRARRACPRSSTPTRRSARATPARSATRAST